MKLYATPEDYLYISIIGSPRIRAQPFKVCEGSLVIERATPFITRAEMPKLKDWLDGERTLGDVWQAGAHTKLSLPRFQVRYYGKRAFDEMIPMVYPGEYLFFEEKEKVTKMNWGVKKAPSLKKPPNKKKEKPFLDGPLS